MITLNSLKSLNSKSKKRVARGNSGKSSGRGLKGQKARSGVSLKNFQGGQTPLERRVPKHGCFKSLKKNKVYSISLSRIDYFINQYKNSDLIPKDDGGSYIINKDFLTNFNFIKKKDCVKLIGETQFSLFVSDIDLFSEGAKTSILQQGKIEFVKS